jgi:hypothetical protein
MMTSRETKPWNQFSFLALTSVQMTKSYTSAERNENSDLSEFLFTKIHFCRKEVPF